MQNGNDDINIKKWNRKILDYRLDTTARNNRVANIFALRLIYMQNMDSTYHCKVSTQSKILKNIKITAVMTIQKLKKFNAWIYIAKTSGKQICIIKRTVPLWQSLYYLKHSKSLKKLRQISILNRFLWLCWLFGTVKTSLQHLTKVANSA